MRTPLIAGNWKMNTDLEEAVMLAQEVHEQVGEISGVTTVICPPFVSLALVRGTLAGSTVLVGAQDAYHEAAGAFTGEVSITMLKGLADLVILGHSERRRMFCEIDASVARKAAAVAAHGLRPIVCVGESLEEREGGDATEIVQRQLLASLDGYTDWPRLVVAYEPVWAIGTGRAASPETAQQMMGSLRAAVAGMAGAQAAENLQLLYGGSVNGDNAPSFFEQPDIDGALVGGASLTPIEFKRIVVSAVPR